MINLIKSSFRALGFNKISMISLTIMIFFTSAVFTLLNDTSNNFQHSYDQFVKAGNLHDFTINENYSVTGDVDYKPNLAANDNDHYAITLKSNQSDISYPKESPTYTIKLSNQNTNLKFLKTIKTNNQSDPTIKIDPSIGAIDVVKNKNNFTNINAGIGTEEIVTPKNALSDGTTFSQLIDYISTNFSNSISVSINMSWIKSNTTGSYAQYFNTLINNNGGQEPKGTPFTINASNHLGATINSSYKDEKNTLRNLIQTEEQYSFINELKNSDTYKGIDINQFNAININSSADNNYYKVVSTQNHYDVNSNFKIDNNNSPFTNPDNFSQKTIDKSYIFSGEGLPKPDKFSVLKNTIIKNSKDMPKNQVGVTWTDNGNYVTAGWNGGLVPSAVQIKSISATIANVSPGFADAHHKKALSGNYLNTLHNYLAEGQNINSNYDYAAYMTWMKQLPDKYKLHVDNTTFLISGISLTPDFMYPVMDSDHLTPNPKNEALVYTDWRGYEGIHSAFRNNPLESFLVGKYPSGSNPTTRKNILSWINGEAHKIMSFPSNVKIATNYNDNGANNLSAFRVGFIGKLVETIKHISLATILFLLMLTGFISIIITSKYISSRRTTLGLLKSLGYKNFQITSSLLIFPIIASVLGGGVGYLIGLSLQNQMINLFVSYWTIPTQTISFSWVSFVITFVAPIIGLGILTYIVSYWKLSKRPTYLMNPSSGFKINPIAKYLTKIFYGFKATTKFKYSLAFSSIGKLLTLSTIIGGTITTATFYLANHNSFSNAQKATAAESSYKFSVDLETPTIEGGDYRAQALRQWGFTDDSLSIKYIDNALGIKTSSVYGQIPQINTSDMQGMLPGIYKLAQSKNGDLGNVHFPSMLDAMMVKNDPYYLEQHIQMKTIFAQSTINPSPWDLAVDKMPPNQQAAMDKQSTTFVKYLENDNTKITFKNPSNNKNISIEVSEVAKYFFVKTKTTTVRPGWDVENMGPTIPFLALMNYGLKHYDTYKLGYGYIPLAKNDETYTSVKGMIKLIDGNSPSRKDGKQLSSQKITGIQQSSKFINLLNNNSNINYKLFNNSFTHPLIINQFAKKQYGLKIGSTITFNVDNDIYRYQRKIKNNSLWDKSSFASSFKGMPTARFTVAGISDSYQGPEFFTNQKLANEDLGFKGMSMINGIPQERNQEFPIDDPSSDLYNHKSGDFSSMNTFIADDKNETNNQVHFNGIFSENNTDNYLQKSMSVYSASGLYPGLDRFISGDSTVNDLLSSQKTQNAFKGLNIMSNNATLRDGQFSTPDMINNFNNIYGNSIYLSAIKTVNDKNASDFMFNNFTSIENKIEKIIFWTMFIISGMVTMTASNMIISDHKHLISNLKILGFRNREISNIFLSIYTPAILFGILLSMPLVSWLIKIFNFAIFKNTSIYIISPLHWWFFAISLGAVLIIFGLTYLVSWKSLAHKKAIDTLKEGGN